MAFVRALETEAHDGREVDWDAVAANTVLDADTLERLRASWNRVGMLASDPKLMALREQALLRARIALRSRWSSRSALFYRAAVAVVVMLGVLAVWWEGAWLTGKNPPEWVFYRTGLGEQRVIELADHSRVALDAQTDLKARITDDVRAVELGGGQAQFQVSKDASRPFRVKAGEHEIVALGTTFNVEYMDRQLRVSMLEGRVAVAPELESSSQRLSGDSVREIVAGEELRIKADGHASIIRDVDVESLQAWRYGKIVFHSEALDTAVRRMNRYSSRQLIIDDPEIASFQISGVFDAGDMHAFAEALGKTYPIQARNLSSGNIVLRADD